MKKFAAVALLALASAVFADDSVAIHNVCDSLLLGGNPLIELTPAYIEETNWYGNPQALAKDSTSYTLHDSYSTLKVSAKTFSKELPLSIYATCRETPGTKFKYAVWNNSKQWVEKSKEDYATRIFNIRELKMDGYDSTNTYNWLAYVPGVLPENNSYSAGKLLASKKYEFAFEWWYVGFTHEFVFDTIIDGKTYGARGWSYSSSVGMDSLHTFEVARDNMDYTQPTRTIRSETVRVQFVKVVLSDSRKPIKPESSSSIAQSSSSSAPRSSSSSAPKSSSSHSIESSSSSEAESSSSKTVVESSSSEIESSSSEAVVESSSSEVESSSSETVVESSSSEVESSSSETIVESSSSKEESSSSETVVESSSSVIESSSSAIRNICDTLRFVENSLVELVPAYVDETNWYGNSHTWKKDSVNTKRHDSYETVLINGTQFSYELPLSIKATCRETRGVAYKFATWNDDKAWIEKVSNNYATYIYDSRSISFASYDSTNTYNMLAFVPEKIPENFAFASNQILVSRTYEFAFEWWFAGASYQHSFRGTGSDSLKVFTSSRYTSSASNDSLKAVQSALEALNVPDTTKSVRIQVVKVVLVDSRKAPEPESSSSGNVESSSSDDVEISSSSEVKPSSSSSEGPDRFVATRSLGEPARILLVRNLDGSVVKYSGRLAPGVYYVKKSDGKWSKMAVLPR